jgi:hypothetical protein
MSSFYDLLNKINQKPGVYIGSPSLSNLYMFLCGYSFSRQEQGIALTVEEQEFDRFQGWIQQRFKVSASVSWAKIILFYSVDERSGFEMFFELWTEFVCQQRNEISDESERVCILQE